MKLKSLFKKWRFIILLFFLIVSIIAINPKFSVSGVAIKGIELNSSAYKAGMINPSQNLMPTQLEVINKLNDYEIKNLKEYSEKLSLIPDNSTLHIYTDKQEYVLLKKGDIGVSVAEVASSNIRKGLELQGGTRVVLQPEGKITDQERNDLIATMESRLNVYGLSDLKIKAADDILGNRYIVAEVSGVSKEEVKDLIGNQGKFEAKIGNITTFIGGKKDIVFVCRNDGACSGIRDCQDTQSESSCKFEFSIQLSPEAAKKQAEATKDLEVNIGDSVRYLNKTLDFYLDGKKVDSLQISADLKGKETTQVSISGPGRGKTREEAINDATRNMNKLQTILITGSLTTKLNIVKLDTISPLLGKEFINNVLLVGILSIISVIVVVFLMFRRIKVSIAMSVTLLSEVLILLAFAALFKYNLDLVAIAGLIVAVGTGVDDQIVIADETKKGKEGYYNWKDRIKRAFFIILASYATAVAAMIPLLKAGAGLLTGFALVTIVGVSIGVFITRPAFAAMLEVLEE